MMRKNLLKTLILLLVCGTMVAFTGCEKDDDGGGGTQANHFTYDGKTYSLSCFYVEYNGYDNASGSYIINIDLYDKLIGSDGYSSGEHYINFDICTNTNTISPGNYNYSATYQTNTFSHGEFYGGDRGDESWQSVKGNIISGDVKISKSGNIYEITVNGIDETGKAITGYYKGSITIDPDPDELKGK